MSQRFVTIGKLVDAKLHEPWSTKPGVWRCLVEFGDDCRVSFETPFLPPPIGSAFEIRVQECGDFYGTG